MSGKKLSIIVANLATLAVCVAWFLTPPEEQDWSERLGCMIFGFGYGIVCSLSVAAWKETEDKEVSRLRNYLDSKGCHPGMPPSELAARLRDYE